LCIIELKSQPRTEISFNLGNNELEIVERYKYLGVILDAHLVYSVTASTLAESTGRALGAVYNKFR
jgi:hypothetical protein